MMMARSVVTAELAEEAPLDPFSSFFLQKPPCTVVTWYHIR
jgi:hypothetical protein